LENLSRCDREGISIMPSQLRQQLCDFDNEVLLRQCDAVLETPVIGRMVSTLAGTPQLEMAAEPQLRALEAACKCTRLSLRIRLSEA